MPISPERRSTATVLQAMRQQLAERTDITNFASDSKSRALLDVLANQVTSLRNDIVDAFQSNSLSTARGARLDALGALYGIARFDSRWAAVDASEQSFAFYVESGDFGDINGNSNITITPGTSLFSPENENESGARIEFVVTTSTVLASGDSMGFVTARAVASGTRSNVGQGVVNSHNFTNYVDSANDTLKFINFYPVLNGRDQETDEQYLFRLAKRYDQLLADNDNKTKLLALQVPGVLDVRVIPGFYGIGTAGVLVLGTDYQSSPSLLEQVQARLDSIKSPGLSAIATSATSVAFDLTLSIKPTTALNERSKLAAKNQIAGAVDTYFRRLVLGSLVNLVDLSAQIQQATQNIFRLRNGSTEIFEQVFIRKSAASGSSSERQKLIADVYELEEHEFGIKGVLTINFVQ